MLDFYYGESKQPRELEQREKVLLSDETFKELSQSYDGKVAIRL
jgi:hypothetical protein